MMIKVAPALCMAFKGVPASALWDIYDGEGGLQRCILDIEVASEINEQISEAHNRSSNSGVGGLRRVTKDDANAVIARRNARRRAREQKKNI